MTPATTITSASHPKLGAVNEQRDPNSVIFQHRHRTVAVAGIGGSQGQAGMVSSQLRRNATSSDPSTLDILAKVAFSQDFGAENNFKGGPSKTSTAQPNVMHPVASHPQKKMQGHVRVVTNSVPQSLKPCLVQPQFTVTAGSTAFPPQASNKRNCSSLQSTCTSTTSLAFPSEQERKRCTIEGITNNGDQKKDDNASKVPPQASASVQPQATAQVQQEPKSETASHPQRGSSLPSVSLPPVSTSQGCPVFCYPKVPTVREVCPLLQRLGWECQPRQGTWECTILHEKRPPCLIKAKNPLAFMVNHGIPNVERLDSIAERDMLELAVRFCHVPASEWQTMSPRRAWREARQHMPSDEEVDWMIGTAGLQHNAKDGSYSMVAALQAILGSNKFAYFPNRHAVRSFVRRHGPLPRCAHRRAGLLCLWAALSPEPLPSFDVAKWVELEAKQNDDDDDATKKPPAQPLREPTNKNKTENPKQAPPPPRLTPAMQHQILRKLVAAKTAGMLDEKKMRALPPWVLRMWQQHEHQQQPTKTNVINQ